MIEVRIRLDDETRSRRLCDWDATKLDDLIPTLGSWSIITAYGDYGADDLIGQLVLTETSAYFEIVIVTEETP